MGVKRNFLFSAILTVANYIFPLLVYPYVARVLGVENIGICNFVDSIVNYAMLVSLMGITIIGTREIAKARGDKEQLHQAFTALFMVSLVTTLIATVALVAVTYTVASLQPYRKLLLIGIIKLWGNFFIIDWLYKGLEDFRYITMRTIAVKVAFVVSVFVLVRHSSDYVLYFLLMCLQVALNAAFNCWRAARFVSFKIDWSKVTVFFWPFLVLGFYLMLNSMYTTFNITYLGFVCGDTEVGYYTTSTKIFQIILALYTAYSSVILPRASALVSEGETGKFRDLIGKSIDGLMLFAIPLLCLMMIFSRGVVDIIAGGEYGGAVVPMMVVMPLVFIIGYEEILVIQILMPLNHDKCVFVNSVVGAIVGLISNILLVRHLQAVGSALVWVLAEISVLCSAQIFVTRYTGVRFPYRLLAKNVVAYIPLAAISVWIAWFTDLSAVAAFGIGCILSLIYVVAIQELVLRNPLYGYVKQRTNAVISKVIPRKEAGK